MEENDIIIDLEGLDPFTGIVNLEDYGALFVKISEISIKFQRAIERISYNARDFDPKFRQFVQNSTL